MRINHILFFFGAIFLAGCIGRSTPKGIIPRDKMVDLLIQVHLIDGSLVTYTQMPDTLYKYGMAKYLHLFKTFDTDTTQFKKSLVYYAERPEAFDKMYDDVVKELTVRLDSLNKIRTGIVKRDSIKNAQTTKRLQDSVKKAQQAQDKTLKKMAPNGKVTP